VARSLAEKQVENSWAIPARYAIKPCAGSALSSTVEATMINKIARSPLLHQPDASFSSAINRAETAAIQAQTSTTATVNAMTILAC
jgi:hypothetical protein